MNGKSLSQALWPVGIVSLAALVVLAAVACNRAGEAADPGPRYVVVEPGIHPALLFSARELPELRAKAQGEGLAREMWDKLKAEVDSGWEMRGEWDRRGMLIDARALIYQVEGDQAAGREALAMMKQVLEELEPHKYYFEEVKDDFFETENWPKAFAFAYDWLYPLMTIEERAWIVDKLELWCQALYEHTESWWWRDASYNCGAIPVGALGLLCVAIQAEADHPEFRKWSDSALTRIRDNFFPTSWRQDGICYEGPCYAHYHKNATMFGEALRRGGGPDLVTGSGAINAMHYQRHQWLPQGGCGPVGDNTEYGRRVFQEIYLLGIGEMRDQAGLWTFEKYTDRRRLNPLLSFIFYPSDLQPASPATLDLPTSHYFEIAPHRAGYIYSRSEWDNERAHWFNFVTRYEGANHQHYDMSTFLFTAFGEQFATHANVWGYSDTLHGVDFEHNIVIVDGGGAPGHDPINGAGDDCSTGGLLLAHGLGHFADYARGEASRSYADPTLPDATPALRAERAIAFVKQGPNPYVVVVDDIQKSAGAHDYAWQWYTRAHELSGAGTFAEPFLIRGDSADCAISFVEPEAPEHEFQLVTGGQGSHSYQLGLLRVKRQGSRVRFAAVAAAWEHGAQPPAAQAGPAVAGAPGAFSMMVQGPGYSDLLVWQPEETADQPGLPLTCGRLATDAMFALVRVDDQGQVIGYLLGEGRSLAWDGKLLAESEEAFSVSADAKLAQATGGRKARLGRPPLAAAGKVLLPGAATRLFADGREIERPSLAEGLAVIPAPTAAAK